MYVNCRADKRYSAKITPATQSRLFGSSSRRRSQAAYLVKPRICSLPLTADPVASGSSSRCAIAMEIDLMFPWCASPAVCSLGVCADSCKRGLECPEFVATASSFLYACVASPFPGLASFDQSHFPMATVPHQTWLSACSCLMQHCHVEPLA